MRFRSIPAAMLVSFLTASAVSAANPMIISGSAPDGAAAANRQPADEPTRGWPFRLNEPIASPFFWDVNGDGTDEVVIADYNRAYVLSASGTPLPGWPRVIPGRADNCGAAADIDGDGAVEIVFTYEGGPPLLWAYRADGTNKPGFPVYLPYRYWLNASSPVIADLNRDGRLEIGASVEMGVAFFDAEGHALPGWPFLWTGNENLAWSAPAVGDIDGDGRNEVVVGENTNYADGVYAIREDGTLQPGWPIRTSLVMSSPSLADIDRDGVLEVIAQDGDPGLMGYSLYAWNGDGTPVPGFPKSITTEWNGSRANPAVGDVDADGRPEVVTMSGDGYLHVVRWNGMDQNGFPFHTPGIQTITSPQLADVDADGLQEIFLTYVTNAGNQYVGGWRLDTTVLPGFPKLLLAGSQLAAHGSAHVKDMDHDGVFEIVACGTDFSGGNCSLFTVDGSQSGPTTRCEWPKIRRDAVNGGVYGGRDPAGIPPVDDVRPLSLCVLPNPAVAGSPFYLSLAGAGTAPRGAVTIWDASGRRVAGSLVTWTAGRVTAGDRLFGDAQPAAGVYFVRFHAQDGAGSAGTRLVLLR